MNYLHLALFCIFSFLFYNIGNGQVNQEKMAAQTVLNHTKLQHFGLKAALLAMDLESRIPRSVIRKKYYTQHYNAELYIPALIQVSDDFDRDQFRASQVKVNTDLGSIYSVHIPIAQYQEFVATPGIVFIELAIKAYPKLDQALASSNIDQVHAGINLSRPYFGKDVVIGIIDFGFDYTHPTFYDPITKELRIKRVWEQNTLFGTAPPGYSYGQELANEQSIINEKLDLPNSGHGTHVASIAAGSGGTHPSLYKGVAHQSDIVLVSLNAREGIGGNNTGVIDGINYIFEYATSVGKPAVVNISQGHHTGPHDGTSLTDQAIDAMSGPGRVIVGAVGNEGDASGFYLHFDHTFDNENTILSYLLWPEEISAGSTLIDIWGEVGKNFEVNLEIFNPQAKVQEGSSIVMNSDNPISFINGNLVDQEGDTLYFEGGIEINAINHRPHAQFFVDYTSQSRRNGVNVQNLLNNDFIQIRFKATSGTIHAYAANNSGEAFFTDLSGIGAEEFVEGVRVQGGNPRSTMGELGGTAHSIISVGGYTTKNTFDNTLNQRFTFEDVIGDAYFRSSQGPTHDGRIKPDIAAPANLIAAAESSFQTEFDPALSVATVPKGDGTDWHFGIRRGTSAAAPLVAGFVALMLEFDPNLTATQIKDLLAEHAQKDQFTGQTPNQIWGPGKLDAAAIMTALDQPTHSHQLPSNDLISIFPNPNKGTFILESEIGSKGIIKIFDPSGHALIEKEVRFETNQVTLKVPPHTAGIYFLQLHLGDVVEQRKILVLE